MCKWTQGVRRRSGSGQAFSQGQRHPEARDATEMLVQVVAQVGLQAICKLLVPECELPHFAYPFYLWQDTPLQ